MSTNRSKYSENKFPSKRCTWMIDDERQCKNKVARGCHYFCHEHLELATEMDFPEQEVRGKLISLAYHYRE